MIPTLWRKRRGTGRGPKQYTKCDKERQAVCFHKKNSKYAQQGKSDVRHWKVRTFSSVGTVHYRYLKKSNATRMIEGAEGKNKKKI